jgi:hypothetical protein
VIGFLAHRMSSFLQIENRDGKSSETAGILGCGCHGITASCQGGVAAISGWNLRQSEVKHRFSTDPEAKFKPSSGGDEKQTATHSPPKFG